MRHAREKDEARRLVVAPAHADQQGDPPPDPQGDAGEPVPALTPLLSLSRGTRGEGGRRKATVGWGCSCYRGSPTPRERFLSPPPRLAFARRPSPQGGGKRKRKRGEVKNT